MPNHRVLVLIAFFLAFLARIASAGPQTTDAEFEKWRQFSKADPLLWKSAQDCIKNSDWDGLRAALQKIVLVEPLNFEVWDFATHQLVYNVSIEFDDVGKRYEWVIHGFDLLLDGALRNPKDSRFFSRLGWMVGYKIGRADERVEFRRRFSEDKAFLDKLSKLVNLSNTNGPNGKPDNWLIQRKLFEEAERLVERLGPPPASKLHRFTPLLFHSEVCMAQINFADQLGMDGYFGDESVQAWREARRLWKQFSQRDIETPYGFKIRLSDADLDSSRDASLAAWRALDKAHPQLRDSLLARKRGALTDDQRAAMSMPESARNSAQRQLAADAEKQLQIDAADLKAALGQKLTEPSKKLIDSAIETELRFTTAETFRDIVNYRYWNTRILLEPTTILRDARKKTFAAEQKMANVTDAPSSQNAKPICDEAISAWAKAINQFPVLLNEPIFCDELGEFVQAYRQKILQGNEFFPEFPLPKIVEWLAKEAPPDNAVQK